MAETLYQKRQAAKRSTRDIDRLKQDFARKLEEYNVQTGTKLAEYEKKVGEYDAAYGSYESRFNQYQQSVNQFNTRVLEYQGRVAAYNEALEKYMTKNPLTYAPGATYRVWTGTGWGGTVNLSGNIKVGQLYDKNYYWMPDPVSSNYGGLYSENVRADINKSVNWLGSTGFALKPGWEYEPTEFSKGGSTGYIYQRAGADPGEFTEKFTETFTMEAPTAPAEPEALDISAEKAMLEQEKAIMEREIGERTKARTRAVQRGQQRPMLSSGTTLKPKA